MSTVSCSYSANYTAVDKNINIRLFIAITTKLKRKPPHSGPNYYNNVFWILFYMCSLHFRVWKKFFVHKRSEL